MEKKPSQQEKKDTYGKFIIDGIKLSDMFRFDELAKDMYPLKDRLGARKDFFYFLLFKARGENEMKVSIEANVLRKVLDCQVDNLKEK